MMDLCSCFLFFDCSGSQPLMLMTLCTTCTHDFVCMQAMTGMIFKKLFNQALIVWDHCVYVRERLLWYDTEKGMPFLVRDTLARLHRAAAEVLYAEADLVTPCCATFNVNWEQWLGHAPETIMPVVNGLDFNQVKTSINNCMCGCQQVACDALAQIQLFLNCCYCCPC